MASTQIDDSWMWHPEFREDANDTAGKFVHFRKSIFLATSEQVPRCAPIYITADTRYKLYVNYQLVSFGPVKGDANRWFYDNVDIGPFLRVGRNSIGVHVLRLFYGTSFGSSFPRLHSGGLRIQAADAEMPLGSEIRSGTTWETAIDPSVKLRIDEPEDDFLHIYEDSASTFHAPLHWVPAQLLKYQSSTGLSAPWNLCSRMIPQQKVHETGFRALHNLKSNISQESWSEILLCPSGLIKTAGATAGSDPTVVLPAGTTHQMDLEVANHMTAFLRIRFRRPQRCGSIVTLTYAESYEDEPVSIPYLRRKGHRQDYSKLLLGPQDIYRLRGSEDLPDLEYDHQAETEEILVPYHFRTFRFIRLNIQAIGSDLQMNGFSIHQVNYPLDVSAKLDIPLDNYAKPLWTTSIRTLINCMHDCYEDCPFYEQLQYAMDTRSSVLFTYCISGDDRLARQAMIQLHDSFQARIGLTSSRAPSHSLQIIPHFSLYWICTVCDHWLYYGDREFVARFLPVVDAILNYFDNHVHPSLQLVTCDMRQGIWNYHDWANGWRPYGIPPAVAENSISTYTNNLYAYALKSAVSLLAGVGRTALAAEYASRADCIIKAVRQHCFDGFLFTDSVCSATQTVVQHSQLNQAWAVLSGAASGKCAEDILRRSLDSSTKDSIVPTSISMSFYLLRALSLAGGDLYDEHFHNFWAPWMAQLALGLTTWEEDSVSQRSDCHAWGSAPIYEFLAEVAGIRPAQPGWSAIEFKPRVGLYQKLDATVPLGTDGGQIYGHVRVSWASTPEGDTKVSLRVELRHAEVIPIYCCLPSLPLKVIDSDQDLTFVVRKEDYTNFYK